MYISKTLQEENVHSNCLYGFNILNKLEGWTHEKKFLMGIWIFLILCPKVSDPPYVKILQIFTLG